jgi:acyl-CoA synthetase
MLDHLGEHGLSKYDMPEYFIAMDAFPQTASGKILKRELVEMAKAGKSSRRRCGGSARKKEKRKRQRRRECRSAVEYA